VAIIILAIATILEVYTTLKTLIYNKACDKGKLPSLSDFTLIKTPFKA